jgi:membrane-associated PAP2 superfamily phosphatase
MPPQVKPLLAMGLASFFILLINRYTDIDVQITNLFFDVQTHSFPLKDVPWLVAYFHDGLKYVSAAVWLLLLLKLLQTLFTRQASNLGDALDRNGLVFNYSYVLVASLLTALFTTYLKTKSNYACPWGLEIYGASSPHLRLLDSLPNLFMNPQCRAW